MSEQPKFEIDDRVRVEAGHGGTRECGMNPGSLSPVVGPPRRITSIDEIRVGATYDLAGALLVADEDRELAIGNEYVFTKNDIRQLIAAGAAITEVSPAPGSQLEPVWQPGDWVKDERGRTYFYLPESIWDDAQFRADRSQPDECGSEQTWFHRADIKGPLRLHYRHGDASGACQC
jgi:hypothetical protein